MTHRWVRSEGVLWRSTLERVVAMPPQESEPLALDGTAAAIWHLLARPRALDDLVANLAALYEHDPSALAADLHPFLEDLEERGMVRSL